MGGQPHFCVKLDFEIAVDHQTRTCDQTLETVADSGCPPVPAEQPRPYLIQFWFTYVKSPNHVQNQAFGCFTCSYKSPEHV